MVYSGQCVGPSNITRNEGQTDIAIPCGLNTGQATPFWKINSSFYYPSDVPPPFIASLGGRIISIPVIYLCMNGTSFQCFVPTSSGRGLISSSTGTLTVRETGKIITICTVFIQMRDPNKRKFKVQHVTNVNMTDRSYSHLHN